MNRILSKIVLTKGNGKVLKVEHLKALSEKQAGIYLGKILELIEDMINDVKRISYKNQLDKINAKKTKMEEELKRLEQK